MNNTDILFKCFSDETRRELVRLLGEAPLTVGEIAEVMRLPQSTVSRHLKTLRGTGLLSERREGNRIFNSVLETSGNGDSGIASLLNDWLLSRPLSDSLRLRLDHVLGGREGKNDAFARLAYQWDELRRSYFGNRFHLEALASLLPESWTVLDIGTGTGYLLPFLARHFKKVVAIDPSPTMLELAQERVHREGLKNVDFKLGRLESLPLEEASVDAVLAILVLHHASEIEASLGEIRRVLRGNGPLLVVDLVPHQNEAFQREMGDPSRGLSPQTLVKRLEKIGFQSVRRRILPPPPPEDPDSPEREAPEVYVIKALAPGMAPVDHN